jgi:hypothetical protein
MRNLTVTIQTTLLLGLVAISNNPARAAEASLTACPSDKTVIGGVNACGKVWKLNSGDAALSPDGKLVVDLHGLVLNDASVGEFNGSPDGVDAVAVAVVCGGTVGAQTEPVALSKTGDVHIATTVTVPKSCTAPTILVRERYEGKIGGWLAASGR